MLNDIELGNEKRNIILTVEKQESTGRTNRNQKIKGERRSMGQLVIWIFS